MSDHHQGCPNCRHKDPSANRSGGIRLSIIELPVTPGVLCPLSIRVKRTDQCYWASARSALVSWSVFTDCLSVAKILLSRSSNIFLVHFPLNTGCISTDLHRELLSEHITVLIQKRECPVCNILVSAQKCEFSP